MYARGSGFPTFYFPSEYEDELGFIPVGEILKERLDPQWIKDWLKLWPSLGQIRKVNRSLEYSISGNGPDCRKRMVVFVKEFCERLEVEECTLGYKLDVIWKATEAYLSHLEDTQYKFAKKNVKFIKDTNGSVLEDWCRRIINDEVEAESTTFAI